jgi:Tfp pilus assembly protein PilW
MKTIARRFSAYRCNKMNTRTSHSQPAGAGAFTMVECLIALTVSAMLLAAVAVAFNASITNYRENEKMYETMNNARQALTRMTSELRTATGVDANEPNNRCVFLTGADPNQLITYEFRDATDATYPNKLLLVKNGNYYVLCDNVTAATFTKTPSDDPPDAKSVQISLTVQEGDFERTLAAAAVVRRSL